MGNLIKSIFIFVLVLSLSSCSYLLRLTIYNSTSVQYIVDFHLVENLDENSIKQRFRSYNGRFFEKIKVPKLNDVKYDSEWVEIQSNDFTYIKRGNIFRIFLNPQEAITIDHDSNTLQYYSCDYAQKILIYSNPDEVTSIDTKMIKNLFQRVNTHIFAIHIKYE